jgi:hypothetical protein
MSIRLKQIVLALAVVAVSYLLWGDASNPKNSASQRLATRYHSRHRTAQFFVRSTERGRREVDVSRAHVTPNPAAIGRPILQHHIASDPIFKTTR